MLPENTPEQRFANQILQMTPEQFNTWAEKCSLEEVAQATQIIRIANQQLREEMECLQEEEDYYIETELNDMSYDNCGFADARYALDKFTLNGIK